MKKLIFIFACMPVYAATCPSGMIAVEYDTFVPDGAIYHLVKQSGAGN